MAFGAGGAWAYREFLGPSKSDQQAAKGQDSSDSHSQGQVGGSGQSKSAGSKKSGGGKSSGSQKKSGGGKQQSGESASQIPGFTSADDAETLKKQLKHLSSRLDSVNKRIDQIRKPENETPPVLHMLQIQVADLSKTIDEIAKLPAQVRHLEHRLLSLTEKFKTLREEVAPEDPLAMPGEIDLGPRRRSPRTGRPFETREDAETTRPMSEYEHDVDDDDATMELGIELFEAGRYAQAREVFRRLQRQRPNDARVWYYSALANGLITHDWGGETKQLFERAADRERAGTPTSEQIDAAFTGLMPGEAERHLEAYRPGGRKEAQKDDGAAAQEPKSTDSQFRLSNQSLEVP